MPTVLVHGWQQPPKGGSFLPPVRVVDVVARPVNGPVFGPATTRGSGTYVGKPGLVHANLGEQLAYHLGGHLQPVTKHSHRFYQRQNGDII